MLRRREVLSRLSWSLRPRDKLKIDDLRIVDGRYIATSEGSKMRMTAFARVSVPSTAEDPRMDYSAALRSALQQQRMRGLFEGLHRAAVPFLYIMMMNDRSETDENPPVFEFDLVVGTWAEGEDKDSEETDRLLEQRLSVLAATLSVALPTATVERLTRNELPQAVRTLLLPGVGHLRQIGSAETGSALCSFEESTPQAVAKEQIPEFYVPNADESGRDGILLGTVRSRGGEFHEFRLQLEDFKRHVAILGTTGSGKSTTGASIVKQVADIGLPMTILDWHNEYGAAVSASGGKVVQPGKDEFSMNPIEIGPRTDPVEHIAMVSDIFSDVYHFTHPQAYMFRNALQKRVAEAGAEEVPTLTSLVRTIEAYPLRSAYDNETKVALLRRLAPLTQGQAGKALGGSGAVSLEELLGTVVCVELGHLRDIQTRAVFAEVLLKMIYEEKVRHRRALEHMTVIEEARNVAPARRPEEPPSVGERMISELRKFGEAMIFVAQFPTHVAAEVVKNAGTKVVHRLAWPDDVAMIGESLGLTPKQKEHLTKLVVGEAIVGTTRIQHPILIQVRADGARPSNREFSLEAER